MTTSASLPSPINPAAEDTPLVMDEEQARALEELAWEFYVREGKRLGYDSPKRLPPPEFLKTRCDV